MRGAFRRNWVLMTCSVASSWRQRQHILMMSTRTSSTSSLSSLTTLCIWNTVCSLCSILRSLYHWWQLQLLIIRIIAFLSGITFAIADDLLVELDGLVNSSLRTWRIVAWSTWCLACASWVHAGIQRRIWALHQVDVVEASSYHMSRMSRLVVSHIELMKVVWPMHDWVPSDVAWRVLILLKRMEVMISCLITWAKLPMAVASLSSASSKLAAWAGYCSHVSVVSPKWNMRSSSIILIASMITSLSTRTSSVLIIQGWTSRWTSNSLIMSTMPSWRTTNIKTMMPSAASTMHFIP